jgi:cytochrome bd ubiquinol oxidase subunit II
MVDLWFAIAALTLTVYVVLDGFDFGAGALHLIVARTNEERRRVLGAIGPFWDGNEVWLLAAGGTLFVAFPKVLAAGLSGFYFAIFLVLWALILRGIAIEFRSHVEAPLWRAFWDVTFSVASGSLAILFGAALGNLVRGLPLDDKGWFSLALFTDFTPRDPVGILDWYTVLTGVFALVALTAHGAAFLAWKTDGPLQQRSRRMATFAFLAVALLWPVVTIATRIAAPDFFASFPSRPFAWVGAIAALAGLVAASLSIRSGNDRRAFLGSCAFLAGLMVATAALLFPVLLRSSGDPSLAITAYAASNDRAGLATALSWWIVGFPIAIGYFVVVFRMHRGKAPVNAEGEGY